MSSISGATVCSWGPAAATVCWALLPGSSGGVGATAQWCGESKRRVSRSTGNSFTRSDSKGETDLFFQYRFFFLPWSVFCAHVAWQMIFNLWPLQSQQQRHERELNLLRMKAEQEALETQRQLEESRQRAARVFTQHYSFTLELWCGSSWCIGILLLNTVYC